MNKKTLIFFCSGYPHTGEYFIDDEMRVAQSHFEHIYVVTRKSESKDSNRFLPSNATLIELDSKVSKLQSLAAFSMIFCPFFLKELWFVVRKYSPKYWWRIFKIQLVALAQARAMQPILAKFSVENSVLYSYWHDEKALALALFKQKNPGIKCVARAHGWDVYVERHQVPYLPFKNFIFSKLDRTFSISQNGKDYFEQNYSASRGKITVSRLGRFNNRVPLFTKQNTEEILICTCSRISYEKRLLLMVDIVAVLAQTMPLKWVHFGDGPMRKKVERYAKTKLKPNQVEFRGLVPTDEILDFYATNYVDVFVNVSSSEGIPVSIMEAISAGIPTVATAVGGTPEIVCDETGYLLDAVFNPVDAARIIAKYISSPVAEQEKKRKSAYSFWKNNYKAGKNYIEFLTVVDH
ncbi:MAG: glycosyltransferase [Bacteroidales bacterium]|nr:glycosyltransferase [Bacteroidales bacterium]